MPELAANFNHNQPVYTVSEVSFSIKRMVEDHFGVVRLRGEISGFKQASSGHVYFRLKDDNACIDAVCWKGVAARFAFKPEDGLEVVCSGKVTTYPGKSSYQIVIDHMEPAGAGALMALLEKRRKALEEEGLFDPRRKRPLPFMPRVIGIVTSPTGAVIRDILHRIGERFPVHVIVWPVAVQGEAAAGQIAAAIEGFNALAPDGAIPVPDLLIVARGGGSIEDLWAFNEEIVVRAAANSRIALISAVGHETDTTLIDFASDKRAPTPTAAAEMAVPVREELWLGCKQLDARLGGAMQRVLAQRGDTLTGLLRGLPKPAQLLDMASQRFDDWSERLAAALPMMLERKQQQLALSTNHVRPQVLLAEIAKADARVQELHQRMRTALPALLERKQQQLHLNANHLRPQVLLADIRKAETRVVELHERAQSISRRHLEKLSERVENLRQLLESVNYKKILERGFALVKDSSGRLVTSAAQARAQDSLTVLFGDGDIQVMPKP